MKKVKKNLVSFFTFLFWVCLFLLVIVGFKEVALGRYLPNVNFSNPIFNIDYALNKGAAFGLLKEQAAFLCGVAGFVLCFVFYYVTVKGKKLNNWEKISLALICSGIISNTFERLQTGAVIDYINLNFINFPIFNLADVFICGGAILLGLVWFFKR